MKYSRITMINLLQAILLVSLLTIIPRQIDAGTIEKPFNFMLEDLDGNPLRLSDYAGKVVLLNFWATWCPPCKAEIPHFIELVTENKDKGLIVIGLSADRGGVEVVKDWIAKNNVNYSIGMTDSETYQAYQEYLPKSERGGIPFTFIIDRKGKIRHHVVGYREKAEWESLLVPLLNEK